MIKNKDLLGFTYYLQQDKINDIYGKTEGVFVERIVSKDKVTSDWSASLGLLSILGLGRRRERGTVEEVIKTLPPETKLIIALNVLEQNGKCCDLNECLSQHKEPTEHIYYSGEANFSIREENPEQFLVRGNIKDYAFESYCSKEHIISASLQDFLRELSEGNKLKVFCAGYIVLRKEKHLYLSLYYIGGP